MVHHTGKKWRFDKWANVWINLNTIIELQKKLLWIAFVFVYIHNAHKLWFLAGARVNDVFPGDELIPRMEMLFLRTLTRVYSSSSINLFLSLIAYNIFSTFKIQERLILFFDIRALFWLENTVKNNYAHDFSKLF